MCIVIADKHLIGNKLRFVGMTERKKIMEELALVVSKFEDIETLTALINAGENIETIEDLVEYLEEELSRFPEYR